MSKNAIQHITPRDASIQEAGTRVIRHHQAFQLHTFSAIMHAAQAGAELMALRDTMAGSFNGYLEDGKSGIGMPRSTAYKYINLAEGLIANGTFRNPAAITRIDIPDQVDAGSATPRAFARLKGATEGKTLNGLLEEFKKPRETRSDKARKRIGPRRDSDAENARAASDAWAARVQEAILDGIDVCPQHMSKKALEGLYQVVEPLLGTISDHLEAAE